jgi:hypothetical protein
VTPALRQVMTNTNKAAIAKYTDRAKALIQTKRIEGARALTLELQRQPADWAWLPLRRER